MKLLVLIFFLGWLTFLSAQDVDSGETDLLGLSLEQLMNIEVSGASKYFQKISEAPATLIVISRQEIRENGYFDLSDLLKDLPGIDLVDNARGFGEFYTIHGIEGNDRFLVLIDGQKINPVSGTFLSVGNSISLRFARQVEVLYGPASVMYGADAFSGIINIISEKPSSAVRAEGYTSYGSANSIDAGAAVYIPAGENVAFSLMARMYRSDGPDLTGTDSVYKVIKRYKAPLRPEFEQPVDDHTLLLRAAWRDLNISWYRQQFDEGNALGMFPWSYINNKESKWKSIIDILWTDYSADLSPGIRLMANLAWVRHIQDPETQFFKTRQAYNFENTFHQYLTGRDQTLRSGLNVLYHGNPLLEIISGFEAENTSSIPPYANDQVLASPVKFEGNNARLIEEALTIEEQRYSGFIQATFRPTPKIDLIGGIRYDYSSRYAGTANPRLGLINRPWPGTTVKAFYGTAFQAPSLFLQYEQFGSVSGVMLSVAELQQTDPGWELENQKIQTWQFSLDQHFSKETMLSAVAYYHLLDDLIERVRYTDSAYNKYFSTPENPVYSPGFRNENVGKQEIQGLDVSLKTRFSPKLSAYATYSFIHAVARRPDGKVHIPRIAANKVWLGLTARDLFGFLTVVPRYKWVGEISNRNKTVFPAGFQPGYSTFDLTLETRKLLRQTRIFVRIDNLLNSEIGHSGLFDQVLYMPVVHQPGLQIRAGLELSY